MRKFVLVLTLVGLFVLLCAGTAFATIAHQQGDRTNVITGANCIQCHPVDVAQHTSGPHGGYTSATDHCQTCHDVHTDDKRTNGNAALLMGSTLTAACQYCHDLTSTWAGPYNMYGLAGIKAAHRVVGMDVYSFTDSESHYNAAGAVTDLGGLSTGGLPSPDSIGRYPAGTVSANGEAIIPGGDATTGSTGRYNAIYNLTTRKTAILSDVYFTCNSCHTPHGVKTVDKYLGESTVKSATIDSVQRIYLSNRILRQRPNQRLDQSTGETVANAVYSYGSAWCLGCHAGRAGDGTANANVLPFTQVHNHPVNSDAPAYRFIELALLGGKVRNTTDITSQAAFLDSVNANNQHHNAKYGTSYTYFGRDYITFGNGTEDFTADPRTNQQFALTPGDFRNDNDTPVPRPDGFDPLDRYSGGNPVYIDKGPACQQCHGSARDVEQKWTAVSYQDLSLGNPQRASFPHVSENKALLVEKDDDFCTNCHDPNILP